MSDPPAVPPSRAPFPTTRWSRVVAAGDPEARDALAELCAAYWFPIYAFIRRKGHDADRALDLTQDYFARLLERGTIAAADPLKGRFRAFLRADVAFFLADRRDRDRARKRGGGRPVLSIDARDAEGRLAAEPAHRETPERLFERDWALTLIGRAFDRLERHYAETSRAGAFARLKPVVAAEPDAAGYARLAAELGASEGSLRVAVHRLRARYAEALRDEIAATLEDPDPAAIDAELSALFAALGP